MMLMMLMILMMDIFGNDLHLYHVVIHSDRSNVARCALLKGAEACEPI